MEESIYQTADFRLGQILSIFLMIVLCIGIVISGIQNSRNSKDLYKWLIVGIMTFWVFLISFSTKDFSSFIVFLGILGNAITLFIIEKWRKEEKARELEKFKNYDLDILKGKLRSFIAHLCVIENCYVSSLGRNDINIEIENQQSSVTVLSREFTYIQQYQCKNLDASHFKEQLIDQLSLIMRLVNRFISRQTIHDFTFVQRFISFHQWLNESIPTRISNELKDQNDNCIELLSTVPFELRLHP